LDGYIVVLLYCCIVGLIICGHFPLAGQYFIVELFCNLIPDFVMADFPGIFIRPKVIAYSIKKYPEQMSNQTTIQQ
jgi:hypothetical protein